MADYDESTLPDGCEANPPSYEPSYTVAGEDIAGSSSSSSSDDDGVYTFTFEELCDIVESVGLSPEMINGLMAQLLTQHFSCPDWYIYPELRPFVWNSDPSPALRTLQIMPHYKWDVVSASKDPAIVYIGLGQNAQRITIGDQSYQSTARPEASGYVRSWSGAHRFMCIGQTKGQAEVLASELSQWFTEFTPWLISKLPFHDFQVVNRTVPQPFSELGDRVGVALTVSYAYLWAWELVPDGPPLKAATITKSVNP